MHDKIKTVNTQSAPKAILPYSQAVIANGFLFVSGQLPIDASSGDFVQEGIEERARTILQNIQAIALSVGSDLNHAVKMKIFLTDIQNFAKVNEVYASFFNQHLPARTAMQVAALPKNADIEMEAILLVP